MGRPKKQPTETPAINTEDIPWHIDYHKAGKYAPTEPDQSLPDPKDNIPTDPDVEEETLNIKKNGTEEKEVS